MPADKPGGNRAVQVLYMSYRNGDEVRVMATQKGQIHFLRLPKRPVPNAAFELRHLLNPRRVTECSGGSPSGTLLLLPLISALSTLSKVFSSNLESRNRDVSVWR